MAPKVKTVWLQGLTPEEAELFKNRLLSTKDVHTQLLKFLHNKWETIERKGFTEEDYRTMDWTHVQAFNNGRLAMIKEIADLFNFD